jgi:hypothetical protein
MPDTTEKTSCYTYKIEMIVQILAKDQPTAARKLEAEGGYVTSRKVVLQDTVSLFDGNVKNS